MVGHVTSAGRLAVVAVIAGACASTAGLRSAPLDAGETKFYAAPLGVVGPAARQAVLSAGLNVDTVSTPDSLTWMIIANVAVMSGKTCELGDSGCINAGLAGFTGIMLSGTLLGAVIGGGTKSWQLRYP